MNILILYAVIAVLTIIVFLTMLSLSDDEINWKTISWCVVISLVWFTSIPVGAGIKLSEYFRGKPDGL